MATIRNYPMALPEGTAVNLEGPDVTVSVSPSMPFGMSVITITGGGDRGLNPWFGLLAADS